jgi:hypothetical protein
MATRTIAGTTERRNDRDEDDVGEPTQVVELPTVESVGLIDTWRFPVGADVGMSLYGKLLGVVSSRRPIHDKSHEGRAYARRGDQCGACRWFEPRIFREIYDECEPVSNPSQSHLGRYLIHFAGMSIVPGETNRLRFEWAVSPHEVIELLTTRHDRSVFLTIPAARVLAQAANFDADLKEAYLDRAIS